MCVSMDMTARRADWCHEQCFRSMLPIAKLDMDIAEKNAKKRPYLRGRQVLFRFPLLNYVIIRVF